MGRIIYKNIMKPLYILLFIYFFDIKVVNKRLINIVNILYLKSNIFIISITIRGIILVWNFFLLDINILTIIPTMMDRIKKVLFE